MKALSVRQPWADAIVHGGKRTENRSRPVPAKHIGARILIHSSLTYDRMVLAFDLFKRSPFDGTDNLITWPDVRGAILAAATLAGCHRDGDGCDDNCATWGERQTFHWKLADVAALVTPIPAKGALGFWAPTPAVLDAVMRQIEVTW